MKVNLGNTWLKLGASVSTYLMASNAFAQSTNLSSLSTQVSSQVGSVPTMISYASYAAGAGIGMNGVLKLRAHSENPGQTPISHGAGRLAAGAALIALPWALSSTISTLGAGGGGTGLSAYKNGSGGL
jgi:hypothetical protein